METAWTGCSLTGEGKDMKKTEVLSLYFQNHLFSSRLFWHFLQALVLEADNPDI